MQYRLINRKLFVAAGLTLLLLASVSYGPSVSAAGNSVTKLTLSPSDPNVLVNGDKVTIHFSYTTTQPGGVRIFARPFVGNSAAPGYAASGAQVSPTGSGTGTQDFTITTGNVTVNRIRIQMFNSAQSQLLFEVFVPVSYEFRTP
ncbi:MAG TPA: hypothetical protein VJZ91_13375 [Blastocatellia bacterium]|nr:hypothetical protein [Blastocatellia bacterium]